MSRVPAHRPSSYAESEPLRGIQPFAASERAAFVEHTAREPGANRFLHLVLSQHKVMGFGPGPPAASREQAIVGSLTGSDGSSAYAPRARWKRSLTRSHREAECSCDGRGATSLTTDR